MSDIVELSKEAIALNKSRAKEINKLCEKLYGLMKKSALIAFDIGKLVYEAYVELQKKDFYDWVKQNLTISDRTASNYKKLYEYFYNEPERLKELTIMEAYVEAGITIKKELPAPKDDETVYTAGIEDDDDVEDKELQTIFKRPTLSGIKLSNYRVETYGEELWGFRKGFGRFPIADIRLTKPAALPNIDWEEMQKNVCIAFESYYAKIEEYENTGKIPVPEDTRFGTLMKNKSSTAKEA